MWLKALLLFQKFLFLRVIARSVGQKEDIRLFYNCKW